MDIQIPVMVMGSQTGTKKAGGEYYKVDLYSPGIGAFDKTVTAAEYVKYASMAPGTPMMCSAKIVVEEKQIKAGDRSFAVRALGVRAGDLALPENARKAG